MRRFALGLALLVFAGCAAAGEEGAWSVPRDDRLEELRLEHGVTTLGVGLVRRGSLVWSGVYGSQAPGVEASRDSMFNAASVAKAVTAETVLELIERGLLDLDEPLSDHWIDPDLEDDVRHRSLTPRLVLTHRTGLPNWRYLTDDRLVFVSDPGERFGYSGEGFELLRRAVEAKLGRPFEGWVRELVFEPRGMDRSAFVERGGLGRFLVHPRLPDGTWSEPNLHPPGESNAADDLFLSVADFAALIGPLWSPGKASSPLPRWKATIQTEVDEDPTWRLPAGAENAPLRYGFGLGWLVFEWASERLVWHGGNDATEHAIGYLDPSTGDGVVVLTNGAPGLGLLLDVLDLVDDHPPIADFYRGLLAAAGAGE